MTLGFICSFYGANINRLIDFGISILILLVFLLLNTTVNDSIS
jgi:hypothetical protein